MIRNASEHCLVGQRDDLLHPDHPNGVTEAEYRELLRTDPARAKWGWRRMQRDAAVYARGAIRHPDHRTIWLPFWHRVLMNTETRSRTMQQVAFLD